MEQTDPQLDGALSAEELALLSERAWIQRNNRVAHVADRVAKYAFAGAGIVAGLVFAEVTRHYGILAHTYGPPTSAENIAWITDGLLITAAATAKSISVAAHAINTLVIYNSHFTETQLTAPSA